MLTCSYWLGFAHHCLSWYTEGTSGDAMGSGHCLLFLFSGLSVCMPLLSRLPVFIFLLSRAFRVPYESYLLSLPVLCSAEGVKTLSRLKRSSCIRLFLIINSALKGEDLIENPSWGGKNIGVRFVCIWHFLQDPAGC